MTCKALIIFTAVGPITHILIAPKVHLEKVIAVHMAVKLLMPLFMHILMWWGEREDALLEPTAPE